MCCCGCGGWYGIGRGVVCALAVSALDFINVRQEEDEGDACDGATDDLKSKRGLGKGKVALEVAVSNSVEVEELVRGEAEGKESEPIQLDGKPQVARVDEPCLCEEGEGAKCSENGHSHIKVQQHGVGCGSLVLCSGRHVQCSWDGKCQQPCHCISPAATQHADTGKDREMGGGRGFKEKGEGERVCVCVLVVLEEQLDRLAFCVAFLFWKVNAGSDENCVCIRHFSTIKSSNKTKKGVVGN